MSYAIQKHLDGYIESKIAEVDSIEKKNEMLNSNRVVCVDIYGHWCEPCKKAEPVFAKIAKEFNEDGVCVLAKEDVDLGLTEIRGVPTFMIYLDGKINKTITGADMKTVRNTLIELLTEIKKDDVVVNKYQEKLDQNNAFQEYRRNNPDIFPN